MGAPRRPASAASSVIRALVVALFSSVAIVCAAATAMPSSDAIPVELWDRPRSGRAVLAVPLVQRVLRDLASNPAAKLTIRHASGGEASGQAEELRAWFIAHAIEPERIDVRGDLAAREPIRLDVSDPKQR